MDIKVLVLKLEIIILQNFIFLMEDKFIFIFFIMILLFEFGWDVIEAIVDFIFIKGSEENFFFFVY